VFTTAGLEDDQLMLLPLVPRLGRYKSPVALSKALFSFSISVSVNHKSSAANFSALVCSSFITVTVNAFVVVNEPFLIVAVRVTISSPCVNVGLVTLPVPSTIAILSDSQLMVLPLGPSPGRFRFPTTWIKEVLPFRI